MIFLIIWNSLYAYDIYTGVLDYKGNYGCDDLSDLDYTDDTGRGFYNTMVSRGNNGWGLYENQWVWRSDFYEDRSGYPDNCSITGNDRNYVDYCEFSWFGGHGNIHHESYPPSDTNAYWRGVLMYKSGNDDRTCVIDSVYMRLGDKSNSYYSNYGQHISYNKYLMLYSCHSLELDYIEHRHKHNDCQNQHSNYGVFQGLHMIFGFDGKHYAGWTTAECGEDFADELYSDNIADAWLWAMSDWYFENTIVVLSAGNSSYHSCNRLDTEWHNNINHPFPPNNWCWEWIED